MATQPQTPAAGDRDNLGLGPAEIPAEGGDFDQPSQSPPEVDPAGGDTDEPDAAPAEIPAEPRIADVILPPD